MIESENLTNLQEMGIQGRFLCLNLRKDIANTMKLHGTGDPFIIFWVQIRKFHELAGNGDPGEIFVCKCAHRYRKYNKITRQWGSSYNLLCSNPKIP